jgi:hypothetical protein
MLHFGRFKVVQQNTSVEINLRVHPEGRQLVTKPKSQGKTSLGKAMRGKAESRVWGWVESQTLRQGVPAIKKNLAERGDSGRQGGWPT